MMTYIIRNDKNHYLWWVSETNSMDMHGNITEEPVYEFECPEPEYAHRWDSRRRADEAAKENGGIVQRLTIETEDVGLRWTESTVLKNRLYLWDGANCVGFVHIKDNFRYEWNDEDYDSLEEAQELAEAAARREWT